MRGMKKCMPDVITGIVMLLFLVTLSLQVPAIPKDSRSYPLALMALSYLMTVIFLIKSLLRLKASETAQSRIREQLAVLAPYGAIILAYLFVLDKIGYILDTFLFCMVSLLYLRLKNKVLMTVLSAVLTLLLYFVFTRFLSVILPKGSILSITL